MAVTLVTLAALGVACLIHRICISLIISPLAKIPGPKTFAVTAWRLRYEDWRGTRTRTLHALHIKYGPVVRIGPSEVSFNSVSALRTIYGAGNGFERTSFYSMFDAYGRKNMFSFSTSRDHGERKKMIAHAYAKSVMLKGANAKLVETKVQSYLELLAKDEEAPNEIFKSLHYFSLDTITEFLYGKYGKTSCLEGDENDRALIGDIIDIDRRKLSWFAVHFPRLTAWVYSRKGIAGYIASYFYPMQLPTTYTGIRAHALAACQAFAKASSDGELITREEPALIAKLWKYHNTQKTGSGGLDDLDIASECADHLLAGIDTTSDTLMFLIWSLSQPGHSKIQQKVIDEVRTIPEAALNSYGVPSVESSDKLAYVNAVIKETLRLYAPLPATEPRLSPSTVAIDGYEIPAGTIVSSSPYTLHRNPDVFREPSQFDPDRWLDPSQDVSEMNRWFWAFSSGGRMCIGLHLAMAEMVTLVAAVYRKYTTSAANGFDTLSPGITSRYEVFYDERFHTFKEHECMIKFTPSAG